jgi:aryl-alcohol dehydrogenase-like predicted oxidoreductase
MWGTNPPDDEIVNAYRAGFDEGIDWVDTAEVYGPHRSEELVAQAIKGRDEVLVFTKVGPSPIGSGYEAEGIRAGAEGSLRRLGRDVIDLYQIHFPAPGIDIEAAWEAMAGLVDHGLVRFIGVSNFNREQTEACERIRHVDSLQPNFSMLFQPLRELIGWCGEQGIGVISYGPLAFGLLTGAITSETRFPPDDWRSGNTEIPPVLALYHALFAPGVIGDKLATVEALRPVADRLGISLAQLALAWAIQQPGVTGVICGTRSPERARENASAAAVDLSGDDLAEIDDILA